MSQRSNYKTKQKEILINYFKSSPGVHITAGDVCEHCKSVGENIGQSTVYRQLEKLVDEGIINKYIIDPGSPACFEYVGEDSHQDSDVCFHDTYCRKTDTPKQYIQSWTPIVAASQSVKAIEDEREFLKKWVNIVDYV